MANKVLSIVIGNDNTRVCELSYNKYSTSKGVQVYRTLSFSNPDNTVEDGYIINPKLYGEELKKQLEEANIVTDKVIFSISSSKIASREIILPPTKEKNIMDIIKTGASEYFPIDINDYILSYLILEKSTSSKELVLLKKWWDKVSQKLNGEQIKRALLKLMKKNKSENNDEELEVIEDNMVNTIEKETEIRVENKADANGDQIKRNQRVCVYAAPSTLVTNYYSFAKAMNMDIVSLDYSGNSSYQIIKRQANKGTNVYVQLNENDTLVSILRDDVLILQRTIGYGTNMLTDTLLDHNYYNVTSRKEALELLEKVNLLTEPAIDSLPDSFDIPYLDEVAATAEVVNLFNDIETTDKQYERRTRENLAEALHYVTGSLARIIDYYKANHKDEQVGRIYISGAGIRIQGIEEFFYSEIGLKTKKMLKLIYTNAKKAVDLYSVYLGEFLTGIGAVLSPIDFIPKETVKKKEKRSLIIATAIFTCTCIIGSAVMISVSYYDYSVAQKELAAVQKELSELPDVSSVYQKYDEVTLELQGLEAYVQGLENSNDKINEILIELESRLPAGTRVNTMQCSSKGISMSVTASINASSVHVLIAKLYTELEKITYFDSIDISNNITINESAIPYTASFTITCTYAE